MKCRRKESGSALLIVVFITALLAAVVMGHLQVNTEEIQLMQNHIHSVEALATAEAGLNDALAELMADSSWNAGIAGQLFNGGSYAVTFDGSTIASEATTSDGFVARIEANVTIASDGPPHVVRINQLRINP